jgi:uncharacterized protein
MQKVFLYRFISMLKYFVFFFITISASAQLAVPEHGGVWVHDEANVLSAQAKAQLEAMLKAERDTTSNQIAVLIVPSLEGDDISRYAIDVFEKWKLGQAKKDNGVLFLISINDRKMRIEVGYGLEGILTDAMSGRINRNEVAPHFQTGDYDGGVTAGVIAIIQVIKGEYKNDEPVQRKRKRGTPISTILIVLIIIFIASRKRGGGSGGAGYWVAGSMLGRGFGGSSGSWGGGGSDFGGGGGSGGGGSSDSW